MDQKPKESNQSTTVNKPTEIVSSSSKIDENSVESYPFVKPDAIANEKEKQTKKVKGSKRFPWVKRDYSESDKNKQAKISTNQNDSGYEHSDGPNYDINFANKNISSTSTPKKGSISDVELPDIELTETTKPKPLMAIERIEKNINGIKVIANCSFDIYPHTTTIILGNHDSGKTTILEMIAGLTSRNRGNIFVDNLNDKKKFKYEIGEET